MKGRGYRHRIVILITMALLGANLAWCQSSSIHIQSEGLHHFQVQLQGTSYYSSLTGYLVIPQLPAGSYTLVMAFADPALPEYAFDCTLEPGVSRGFSLKLGISNNWSLFDMVEFTTTRGAPATRAQKQMAARKPVDPNSQAILSIRKIFDRPSGGGIDQVYIVADGEKTDTIALFIPVLEEQKPKPSGFNRAYDPLNNTGMEDLGSVVAIIDRKTRKPLL